MSGNIRHNTDRFSSVKRSSNKSMLNEAFGCSVLSELDRNLKVSYNKAWDDLDGLKKAGAEMLKQLKYEDLDITVFTKKLLNYANSAYPDFGLQNAALLNCIIEPYFSNNSKFANGTTDVLSNPYIKTARVVDALTKLAKGLDNVINDRHDEGKSSDNSYMAFNRKRSTQFIMDRITAAGFPANMIKDSDFYVMKKVPKTMSSASKAYDDVLFWTFSKDPNFIGFKETDRLVAVTHGADII